MSSKSNKVLTVRIRNAEKEISHLLIRQDSGDPKVIGIENYEEALGFALNLDELPVFPDNPRVGLRHAPEMEARLPKHVRENLKPVVVFEESVGGFLIAFIGGQCFTGTIEKIIADIEIAFSLTEEDHDNKESPKSEIIQEDSVAESQATITPSGKSSGFKH